MTAISRKRFRRFLHHLREMRRPLVQEADLAICFLLTLHESGGLEDSSSPTEVKKAFRYFRDTLLEFGAVEPLREGGRTHGYRVGLTGLPEPEEAICALDPFAYVSHLSAMSWHGLTDRIPNTLFLTRPSTSLWKELSSQRLQHELGTLHSVYRMAGFPAYRPVTMQKLNRRHIDGWSSRRLDQAYQTAYKKVRDGRVRVATVARCFLDMVRTPVRCGGIYHVIEVFSEHGPAHADPILAEVDRHGNKVEKARTGYLLEEADPGLRDRSILKQWAADVIRGGSRKLDPESDYSDQYSERWALSINV